MDSTTHCHNNMGRTHDKPARPGDYILTNSAPNAFTTFTIVTTDVPNDATPLLKRGSQNGLICCHSGHPHGNYPSPNFAHTFAHTYSPPQATGARGACRGRGKGRNPRGVGEGDGRHGGVTTKSLKSGNFQVFRPTRGWGCHFSSKNASSEQRIKKSRAIRPGAKWSPKWNHFYWKNKRFRIPPATRCWEDAFFFKKMYPLSWGSGNSDFWTRPSEYHGNFRT